MGRRGRAIRVVLLTEGGRGMGFGHAARCHALFEALRAAGARPRLFIRGDRSVAGVVPQSRFGLLDWSKRTPRLRALLRDSDVAVIDSYRAGAGFFRWMASRVPLAVYLDDNKRLSYPPGVVVNGNVHAGHLGYPRRRGRVLLIGPRYALLRRAFRRPPSPPKRREVRRVLVTAGGSSPPGLVPRVAQAALLALGAAEVRAVASAADLGSLRRLAALSRGRLRILPQPVSLSEAMADMDLCVSGGGQTLNELAAFGIPSIGIELADNQRLILRGWERRGFLIRAGRHESPRLEARLRSALRRAASPRRRRAMSRAGRALVDGRGAQRTAAAVLAEASRVLRKGAP